MHEISKFSMWKCANTIPFLIIHNTIPVLFTYNTRPSPIQYPSFSHTIPSYSHTIPVLLPYNTRPIHLEYTSYSHIIQYPSYSHIIQYLSYTTQNICPTPIHYPTFLHTGPNPIWHNTCPTLQKIFVQLPYDTRPTRRLILFSVM